MNKCDAKSVPEYAGCGSRHTIVRTLWLLKARRFSASSTVTGLDMHIDFSASFESTYMQIFVDLAVTSIDDGTKKAYRM